MKKIFVFDMGHVILKPSNLRGMYNLTDSNISYSDFKNLFYHSNLAQDVYKGIIDDDTFFSYLKLLSGTNKNISELKKLYLKFKGTCYDDVIEIIQKMKDKGHKVCLLSNLKVIDYEYLASIMDLSIFDQLFLSYLLKSAKPEKEIYQKVINTLGTNQFYFFDDSLDNINAALSLGINAYQTTGDEMQKVLRKNNINF